MTLRLRKRWKGELARPIRPNIVRPRGLAITDLETVEKANKEMIGLYNEAIEQKFLEKLRLLMEHYEILDKDDWFSLALSLAVDHVPGFRVDLRLGFETGQTSGLVVHLGRRLAVARCGRTLALSDYRTRSSKKRRSSELGKIAKLYCAFRGDETGRNQQLTGETCKAGLRHWNPDCRKQRSSNASSARPRMSSRMR